MFYLFGCLFFVVLDKGELVDALGVVGYGAIAVDCNGHRTHAEHAEGHKSEGEDGIVFTKDGGKVVGGGCHVGNNHQHDEDQTSPESTHIAGHDAGEDVEGGTALFRSFYNLFHVFGGGGGEELGELRNKCCAEGAATDDDGEGYPVVVAEGRENVVAGKECACNAEQRGYPHQAGEGFLEIKVVGIIVFCTGDGSVDIIGKN